MAYRRRLEGGCEMTLYAVGLVVSERRYFIVYAVFYVMLIIYSLSVDYECRQFTDRGSYHYILAQATRRVVGRT